MAVAIILFIVGLLMLIKGGDWFVDGATGIARRFRLPEILIGATVVSIGTTLPEVMVSASAAFGGQGDIAYGNAIGSIICNTALISALTIAIKPSKTDRKTLILPVVFFFVAVTFYLINAYVLGEFYRWSGIVLLVMFVVYMLVTVLKMKANRSDIGDNLLDDDNPQQNDESEQDQNSDNENLTFWQNVLAQIRGKKTSVVREIILLVVGAVLIAFGADFLVDNGIIIAEKLGVPQSVIALTFVALGTSLPELVTAITALVKGHGSLSLGNIIGANLFNLVLVSGVAITINPFNVPQAATLFGQNMSLVLDIPVMLAVMLILTIPTLIRNKISRVQGISLLAIYVSFVALQFIAI